MQEKIKDLLTYNGKIIPQRCNLHFIGKYPDVYDYIMQSFDESYSLQEKIYCIVNSIPKRPTCKTCGKEIKFNHGYANFCSRKCSNSNEDVLKKISNGVSISLKKAYNERGSEIKHKRNETFKIKYNQDVTSPFMLPEVKNKIENTLIKKYGVKNIFYLKEYRSNGRQVSQDKSLLRNKIFGYDIEYLDKNLIKIKNLCKIHGDVTMNANDFYNRTYRDRNDIQCILCNPIHSFSSFELKFEELLKELNITNYFKNTKTLIDPYEIDFYFPEYSLAIELNGVYWHSEIYKDKMYHKLKCELCESKNIRLIQIWEDDFYNKYDIIKSMLTHVFKLKEDTIYARKCTVKEISSSEYVSFLKENHLQGKVNSSIRLGLIHNNEIVAVMGFGKIRLPLKRKSEGKNYELHRFCIKKYLNIPGAASKLMHYFDHHFTYDKLISYVKRDISNGNVYEKMGFKLTKICDPGYYWVVNNKREYRFNYRKNKICTSETKDKTEIEIMHENGYVRCFDSGNLLYEKSNSVFNSLYMNH